MKILSIHANFMLPVDFKGSELEALQELINYIKTENPTVRTQDEYLSEEVKNRNNGEISYKDVSEHLAEDFLKMDKDGKGKMLGTIFLGQYDVTTGFEWKEIQK